jgi:class 3 adenylate cyclase
VQDRFLFRPIGTVELKNIGHPVEVWEVKAAM